MIDEYYAFNQNTCAALKKLVTTKNKVLRKPARPGKTFASIRKCYQYQYHQDQYCIHEMVVDQNTTDSFSIAFKTKF